MPIVARRLLGFDGLGIPVGNLKSPQGETGKQRPLFDEFEDNNIQARTHGSAAILGFVSPSGAKGNSTISV